MTTKKLYGLNKYLLDLIKLYEIEKLPKVLMLSGKKGQGKFTLVHHLISHIFDKDNYIIEKREITKTNKLFNNIKENYFPNVIYNGCNKSIKIEDIRNLRINLQKTSINNFKRYIIFDDVEYLNENCVNALLKTIEEPSSTNYFILINNQKQSILDTLKSRSIEFLIFLNNKDKLDIIKKLVIDFKIEKKINIDDSMLTPGEYLKFNKFVTEEKINLEDRLIINIEKLLKLNKLKKNIDYLNFSIYLINQYYFKMYKNKINVNNYYNNKMNIIKKIFETNKLNLNHTNLISEIENCI